MRDGDDVDSSDAVGVERWRGTLGDDAGRHEVAEPGVDQNSCVSNFDQEGGLSNVGEAQRCGSGHRRRQRGCGKERGGRPRRESAPAGPTRGAIRTHQALALSRATGDDSRVKNANDPTGANPTSGETDVDPSRDASQSDIPASAGDMLDRAEASEKMQAARSDEDEPNSDQAEGFFSSPRGQALTGKALKVLPWGSLTIAIGSALLMDRTYKSAWMVIVAALLAWGALVGFALLSSLDADDFEGRKRLAVKAASVLSLVVTQSLIQQCLFFSIPFYFTAASFTVSHIYFLVVLGGAAGVTLWDPVYEWVMARAPLRFFLMGFSVFAGLNAVIPVLGVGNGVSLAIAGFVAGLGVPVQSWLLMPHDERPSHDETSSFLKAFQVDFLGFAPKLWLERTPPARWARIQFAALLVGICVPFLVVLLLAQFIPPAPLEMVHIQLQANRTKEREQPPKVIEGVPEELNCVTWVWGPGGFHDELIHVWFKDGREVDRVPLEVLNKTDWEKWRLIQQKQAKAKGQSEKQKWGYRTNSRKRHLTKNPIGKWTCAVQTQSGQVLGEARVVVKNAEAVAE